MFSFEQKIAAVALDSGRYTYPASVISVTDGDTLKLEVTLDCEVDVGFGVQVPVHAAIRQTFRLLGIDTWELFKHPKGSMERERGEAAKVFVEQWVRGHTLVIKTYKDTTGKYGRYLVEIWRQGDEVSLEEALRAHGHEKEKD